MTVRLLPGALVLALLLAPIATRRGAAQEIPAAEQYHVRVEYLLWSPQPVGQLQKGVSDREGTLIDAVADLGMQSAAANELRAVLRLGAAWKLRGSWSPIDFQGELAAPRAFSYGTAVVSAGDDVRCSIKGNYGSAELEWDFVRQPQGFVGLLVGTRIIDVDTLLLNVGTADRVVETQRFPIPVLGLTGRYYLGRRFSVEGELAGLTIGDRGHIWEWAVAGRVHVLDRFAGTVGYRKIGLAGRTNRDFLQLDLGRWTLGIEISL